MLDNKLYNRKLSLREKIAQLFIIGFKGSDISDDSEILRTIELEKPGGVILFDQDMVHNKPVHNIKSPEQVKNLTRLLKEKSELPLIIGVDQEGGLIHRLKPEYGFPETVSHKHMGNKDDLVYTRTKSEEIAKVLSEVGINLNFAPVVDLESNKKSSIISKRERSFGSSAELVTRHAMAYVEGHQKYRILTCCKHFPGHGSAAGDSHAGFVDVTETWQKNELKPYKNLIAEEKCPMIMTAHIFHSDWDSSLPATFSEKVLQKILRDELGFTGVVISDDMQMRAISDTYSLKDSLLHGLNGGLDMFCFGNNLLPTEVKLSEAIDAVEELVINKKISLERIDQSVKRILGLKSDYLL
tara:strand:- start:36887 stop:37951 length:1065 start_codon:yes stop_codon:yes gene_type:complete